MFVLLSNPSQNFLCAGFRLYQVLEYVNLKVIEMESCEREFTAERMQNQICVSTQDGTAATCHVRKSNISLILEMLVDSYKFFWIFDAFNNSLETGIDLDKINCIL
jgi:hypothetical protein